MKVKYLVLIHFVYDIGTHFFFTETSACANRLKQKQISQLKNENMMTACTPEKENNYE